MIRLLVACFIVVLAATVNAEPAAQNLLWVETIADGEVAIWNFPYGTDKIEGAGTLVDRSGLVVVSLGLEVSAYRLQRFVVTSPVTEKRYEADLVAVDSDLGLGFLKIADWSEDLPPAQFVDRDLKVGEQVSVLDRLTPDDSYAVTKAFATVGGHAGQRRPQALLDRALVNYRGLPVLDAKGQIVGLVGGDCGKMTRVFSAGDLKLALQRLEAMGVER